MPADCLKLHNLRHFRCSHPDDVILASLLRRRQTLKPKESDYCATVEHHIISGQLVGLGLKNRQVTTASPEAAAEAIERRRAYLGQGQPSPTPIPEGCRCLLIAIYFEQYVAMVEPIISGELTAPPEFLAAHEVVTSLIPEKMRMLDVRMIGAVLKRWIAADARPRTRRLQLNRPNRRGG